MCETGTWGAKDRMVRVKSCAKRGPGVSRRRLYEDLLNVCTVEELPIGKRVERAAAGHAEVAAAGLALEPVEQVKEGLLVGALHAGRDVEVTLRRFLVAAAGRRPTFIGGGARPGEEGNGDPAECHRRSHAQIEFEPGKDQPPGE